MTDPVAHGSGGLPVTPRTDWTRPVPVVGDTSAAAARAADPRGWAFDRADIDALDRILRSRRDIRRFRPDPVPDDVLEAILSAGHAAPSVGHSQPWRFIVVADPALRDRAAVLADRMRLEQAYQLTPDRARRLLDLKLEGLREAPVGIVVACDRRTPAAGVLGRATFPDTDLWSCACAIENMWLTARAHGVGMGWVTLFEPADLGELLGLPEGVETLGWLCLGWPDELPPEPGLQRHAWSSKLPLNEVVLRDGWPVDEAAAPSAPVSHLRTIDDDGTAPTPSGALRAPAAERLVAVTDDADRLLTPPESLGVLDRALNRLLATGSSPTDGTLVLVGADHPVAELGVSAYPVSNTVEVFDAAAAGQSLGAATARTAGLDVLLVDAGVRGGPAAVADRAEVESAVRIVTARPKDLQGNLRDADALTPADVESLVAHGRALGRELTGLAVLGEIGIGNTTVAAALTSALTGLPPARTVGLGAGSDAAIMATKTAVVEAALARAGLDRQDDPIRMLAAVGGPEFAVLMGVTLGAAETGTTVVLDGLATSVAALLATRVEPAVQAYLVAGQVSREQAHGEVLRHLGLEPILQLRLRAGEGVGGCMAASLLIQALRAREHTGRTGSDSR
ncbi:5,6-dimethylbenzimidazole synthase [Granulicoccus sp. GXG6511]|uniref:5,6-dimethylbenzimidazole synthase n=1 Tax=Granulicoccus sp. GXG6511 TaxID=3381351 RepID=UPI003D7E3F8C